MAEEKVKCVDCGEEFPKGELNRQGRCHKCAVKAIEPIE